MTVSQMLRYVSKNESQKKAALLILSFCSQFHDEVFRILHKRDNAASGLWCCVQSLFFMEDIWTRQRRKVYITKLTLGHFHSAFLRFLTKQPFTTTIRQSVSCEGWKQPLKNEQERTICVKTGTCTLNKNYKCAKKKKALSGILGPSAL